jgi:hypothetical protein
MITANLGWVGLISLIAALIAIIVWLVRRHAENRAEIRRLEAELRRTAYWNWHQWHHHQ